MLITSALVVAVGTSVLASCQGTSLLAAVKTEVQQAKGGGAVSISLSSTSATLVIGSPYQLTASVKPSTASQQVTWSSSNPQTASVSSSGVVAPLALGSATITATTMSGSLTATCAVTCNVIFESGALQTSTSNYGLTVPVYCKNNVLSLLPTTVALPNGSAKGWGRHGTDIYICGYLQNGSTGPRMPVYWKNGVLYALSVPAGSSSGSTQSIWFDSSGNCYVRGVVYQTSNGNPVPGYWYNGAWQALSMTLPSGTATSGRADLGLFVDNGDVYFSGYLLDPVSNLNVPVYWKNGSVNVVSLGTVPNGTHGGQVEAVIFPPVTPSFTLLLSITDSVGNSIPAYEVNGAVTEILSGTYTQGRCWWARSSPSGDVYATGEVSTSNSWPPTGQPSYWLNWNLETLQSLAGETGYTGGTFFAGSDTYVDGTLYAPNGAQTPVYWKDGVLNTFPIGSYVGGSEGGIGLVDF